MLALFCSWGKKVLPLSLLSVMLAMNALCHANKIPLMPSLLKEIFFVMKEYAMHFVKCLLGSIEMTLWLSLQVLLILCITSIGFPMLNHSFLPSINPINHGV